MPDPVWSQRRLLEQYFAQSIRTFPDDPIVISEGDSWFSFPVHANTIDHLDELVKHRISLLRLEESGDTLFRMTAGSQRSKLRHLLTIYDVDALLFSGGGNDAVGPELLDLFDIVPPGESWQDFIIQDAMERQFRLIADAYHSLAHLRDVYRPDCWIVTHGYDYVKPSGKPTTFWLWPIPLSVVAGPWVKSNLEARGILGASQAQVVGYLIDRLNETLAEVAAEHERFVAIDNRGLLKANEWSDELHPTRAGFKKIARSFLDVLQEELPDKF
ncbi:MAG: hypothetical protein JJE51_01770 [Thermoanaerobaculia bacterium]|nr:hypothetical protein [Thermoanaerobaculia bacterium]